MQQSPQTRALQHLLVQEFTPYPCHAAVCLLLLAPGVLTNPQHGWAIVFDRTSLQWMSQIPTAENESRMVALMRQAAVQAQSGACVLCHVQAEFLLVPLTVTDVRGVRMQIEAAVIQGKVPSPEKLGAFTDEMLKAEIQKRKLNVTEPDEGLSEEA